MTFRFKNGLLNAGQKSTVFFDRKAFRDSKTNTGDTAVEAVTVPLCVMRAICDALRSDLQPIFHACPTLRETRMSNKLFKQLWNFELEQMKDSWKRRVILEACERMIGGTLGGPRARRSRAGE